MNIYKELLIFLLRRKKYWLFPLVFISALFGGLVVVTEGSALAPFIYSIF